MEHKEAGDWLCPAVPTLLSTKARVAPLGTQALCLELASQGEHLPWQLLLGEIHTKDSELAESPADNEHKSRAGVHLFFAGDVPTMSDTAPQLTLGPHH